MLWLKGYLTKKTFLEIGIVILGIASILIAIVTYYGQNAGNFVMQVDEETYRRSIILCDEPEFISPTPRLLSKAIVGVRDITYDWIDTETVKNTNGNYTSEYYKYIAYTFYIKNDGNETCDLAMTMEISSMEGTIDGAIRVLIIKEDETETMYMKKDDPEMIDENTYDDSFPKNIKYFENDKTIFSEEVYNFLPQEVNKYTVIIWLEGQDPDCNDTVLGGKIKFRLLFSILNDGEE